MGENCSYPGCFPHCPVRVVFIHKNRPSYSIKNSLFIHVKPGNPHRPHNCRYKERMFILLLNISWKNSLLTRFIRHNNVDKKSFPCGKVPTPYAYLLFFHISTLLMMGHDNFFKKNKSLKPYYQRCGKRKNYFP